MSALESKTRLPLAANIRNGQSTVPPEDADLELLQKELDKVTSFTYELPWSRDQPKTFKGPPMPSWFLERPFLTGDYIKQYQKPDKVPSSRVPLSTLPLSLQEYTILDDLLYIMTGIEGKYIKMVFSEKDEISFAIDTSLELSLWNLSHRIVPIGVHYLHVSHYVSTHSQYHYGTIAHAFSAAIKSFIKEFLILIAQLENQLRQGKLTLQRMWFYVQGSLKIWSLLDDLTAEAASATGGHLLHIIYHKTTSLAGDEQTKRHLLFLMEKSCVPFFEMLEQWIYRGVIRDTYGEFFIEEHSEMQKENLQEDYNDAYWEQRYTLKTQNLPRFLSKFDEKILVTGKYLNVIRECGIPVKSEVAESFVYSAHERDYQGKIEQAYQFASKQLLDLLMNNKQLIHRLRSIKHYFLLDQGDFFVHFMDTAGQELRKSVADITPSKLNSLLELSLRTSIAVADPFKDDLVCSLLPYNLLQQLMKIIYVADGVVQVNTAYMKQRAAASVEASKLTGLEAFTFDYKVEWPLSLVISRKSLTKYQLIFRHLFLCKHVERQLCSAWEQYQTMRQLQNFMYYMMYEVLEPNWAVLEQNIRKATTIDEVLKYHSDFLDSSLKECMLTDPNLVKIMMKLMSICVRFTSFTQQFVKTIQAVQEKQKNAASDSDASVEDTRSFNKVASEQLRKLASDPGFMRSSLRFETTFNSTVKQLIDSLNNMYTTEANHHLANLVLRLDFNDYYKQFSNVPLLATTATKHNNNNNNNNTRPGSSSESSIFNVPSSHSL